MQEENTFSDTPKRRGAEFVTLGYALYDVVRQTRPHMMNQQVGKQVDLDFAQCLHKGRGRGERLRVTQRASDIVELNLTVPGRLGGRGRRRPIQKSHEDGQPFRVPRKSGKGLGAEVSVVFRHRI